MQIKWIVTMGPEGIHEHLNEQEIKTLFDIIDKLLVAGIQLKLEFAEIKHPTDPG